MGEEDSPCPSRTPHGPRNTPRTPRSVLHPALRLTPTNTPHTPFPSPPYRAHPPQITPTHQPRFSTRVAASHTPSPALDLPQALQLVFP